jgi:predicted amidohydrolase
MPRIVRCSLIQASNVSPAKAMVDKHLEYIRQAAEAGAQIVCLQEIFNGPYFCAEQETRWYDVAEAVPDGPIVRMMQDVARSRRIVLIVPVYEREQEGIYYNTAAVIHNDGTYLGKYRKTHIPHVAPGFWEKFYFRPGNLGYPVFDVGFAKIGVYICYDRHFPEGARALGLNGAAIVLILQPRWPDSASTCGSSSSRRTRSRTDTTSARSTAWESRNRGKSANFTGRATSAIRAARSSRRLRATRTRSSPPTSIST